MERAIKGRVERVNDSKAWARLNRLMLGHPELDIVKRLIELKKAKASPETIFKEAVRMVNKSSVVSEELKKLVEDDKNLSLSEFVEERAQELIECGYCRFELPYVLSDEINEIMKRNRNARDEMKRLIENEKLMEKNPALVHSLKKIEDDLLKNGIKKWEVAKLLPGELLLADLSLRHPLLGLDGYVEEKKRALGISKESLEKIRTEVVELIKENASAEKRINGIIGEDRELAERVDDAKQRLREEGYMPYEILPEIAKRLESMLSRKELTLFDGL